MTRRFAGRAGRGWMVATLVLVLVGSGDWSGTNVARAQSGPTVTPLAIPVGSSPGLAAPALSGTLLVWQDTGGVFGVDLATSRPLPLPSSGGSQPDIAGSLTIWKQGTGGVRGYDLARNVALSPVADARQVDGVAVGETGVFAALVQDGDGAAVRVYRMEQIAEAGRIPAARLAGESLGTPRVSGSRVVFPNLTADATRLSRFIVFNSEDGTRTAINDAYSGTPVFDFAGGRLAVAQGTRVAVFDLNTNAVEVFPVTLIEGQKIVALATDGATVLYATGTGPGAGTAVGGYDLARKVGYTVVTGRANIAAVTVSGRTAVWSESGTLRGGTITFADTAPPVALRTDYRYFPETGYTVGFTFLRYWLANGGDRVFGYPLTNDTVDTASQRVVQYFERSRFESHPEAMGTGDVVQLTNVGRIVTAGRTDPPFFPQPVVPTGPTRSYFVQTQHAIAGSFKQFWERYGGVAVFGYPISEESIEPNPTDGQVYTVQYFERARMEYHPEVGDTVNSIVLGQLGRQLLQGQLGLYRPECTPQYIQKPILPECK